MNFPSLRRKENQAADSNFFGEKTASRHGLFEIALSSLDFVL